MQDLDLKKETKIKAISVDLLCRLVLFSVPYVFHLVLTTTYYFIEETKTDLTDHNL